ncbi:hypothetical protein LTR15_008077 [Elasticomyces elasticus]|nr:hypothetical protein LTR15_008077 [Elasticomyces elasticus]
MSQEKTVGQSARAEPVNEDVTGVRVCAACEGTYSSERAYKRHFDTNAHRLAIGGSLASTITCGLCDKHFTRSSDLKRHQTQGRCPSRLGAQNPPPKVLGKRAFDGSTQPLEALKVIRRLSPILGLNEPVLGSHQAGSSYTPQSLGKIACEYSTTDGAVCRHPLKALVAAAEESRRVAMSEQSNSSIAKPSDLQELLERLAKTGEQQVMTGMTSATQEHALPAFAMAVSTWLNSDQSEVLSNTMHSALEDDVLSDGMLLDGTLSEASTPERLYRGENMVPSSVVIDYEWVDDLPGHYHLMDLDAFQDDADEFAADAHELGHSGSRRSIIMEPATIGIGPDNTSRAIGARIDDLITQQEPLGSSKKRLQQILEDPVMLPPRRFHGRHPLRLQEQKCSLCKKPYEKDTVALRKHLNSHLAELRGQQTAHFCRVCQVGFVHQQDLQHHNDVASSGQCCGLLPGHNGPCKGFLCGFNFRHTAPCSGHHPPAGDATWSDHDRFKFGHLLRKWELSQLRVAAAEANKLQRLRQAAKCLSSVSMLDDGLCPRTPSETSYKPWYTEPCKDANVGDLSSQMSNLTVKEQYNGLQSRVWELKHLKPAEDLVFAAATDDHDAMTDLIRRGATIHDDPAPAVVRGQCAAIETILAHGAHPSLETIYEIMKSVNTVVLAPTLHTTQYLVIINGLRMLQITIRYGRDTLVSMLLAKDVDTNRCLRKDELDRLSKWLTFDAGRHDPHLRDAASSCPTEGMRMQTALLAGRAYADAVGFQCSTLGVGSETKEDSLCVRAILAVNEHVAYDRFWVDDGTQQSVLFRAHDRSLGAHFYAVQRHVDCDALIMAIQRHDRETVQHYLDMEENGFVRAQCDINCALHAACVPWPNSKASEARLILEELVSRGFSLTARDSNGQTPLAWAASCGNDVAVSILVAACAERDV